MKTNKLLFLVVTLLLAAGNLFAQNWQLVWSDEFTNGISGDWVFETGAGGWGNNELQYYRRENASVQNGQLVISAKRESFGGANYTSVRMKTQGKKSWKFGKIEARIATPSFQGVWPAFWMLGDNISSVGWPSCGEIDIMEHVNTGGEVRGTIHWANANGSHAEYGGGTSTNITTFHNYSVEWDASSIKWLVDGVKYHEANIAGNINSTDELHNNFFILLNLAIGGNWPGFSIDNGAFPANMYVDYVRVYQDNGIPPPPSGGGVATVYKDCNFAGYAGGLAVGDYAYGQLYAKGIGNEDISSLKVNGGYQIELFEHDNFTGASIVFGGDDACLVDNGWNDRTTSLKVRAGGTPSFSRTIQAEDYSAMLGVQKENTTDAGGGQNVGYIDNGDWMAYNAVNFPTSGTYTVEYRVASMSGGKVSMDLNAGSIQLGAVNIPATGGWQNWTTVTQTVNVNAGTYNVGLYSQTGGWNINWFRISKASGARVNTLDNETEVASNYDLGSAVTIFPNPIEGVLSFESSTDLSGGQIRIVDGMGTEVMNATLNYNRVDVSDLSAGIYTLLINKDGNNFSRRFVKK
jgi:beta-glucanase (GH16 family)